ncbi:MAG: hypothetical protein ACQEXX_24410 [Bacillota bacterium]
MIQVTETASRKITEIIKSANIPNAFLRVGVEEGVSVTMTFLPSK